MENVLLFQIPIDDFKKIIRNAVSEELKSLTDNSLKFKEDQESKVELIKIEEVQRLLLGLSKPTIYQYIKDKKLPAYHIGNRLFFKKDEVIASLQSSL